jgi:hypothetical protein
MHGLQSDDCFMYLLENLSLKFILNIFVNRATVGATGGILADYNQI